MTEAVVTQEPYWPEGSTPDRPPAPRAVNGHHDETRLPPNDVEAERQTLGGCILDPRNIALVDQIISDRDWYRPAHELIWQALEHLDATGQPVEPAALAHHLGNDLQRAGGALYLVGLTETAAATSATYYARIVAEIAQHRRTVELGTKLTQAGHALTDPETVGGWLRVALVQGERGLAATPSSWAPVDLGPVLDGTALDTRPTLMARTDGPALLYPGAVHLLSGEPTSGKTWLALHALLAELQAGNDAAIVDFEDRAATATGRLLALGATPQQLRDHFRYIRPETALDGPGRAALGQAVTGTTLVILDGVTEAMTLHGLDLSSNPDVATFYALLPRWVAGHGPTVVLIDHVVKDTERQGRWSIGGQHKVAGIDGAAYTVKAVEPMGRGKRGTSRVFIAKDRHGHVEEHALGRCAAEFHLDSTDPLVSVARLDPPEAMPTTEGGDMRPTVLMERVSRYLEINPGSTGAVIDQAHLGKALYVRRALAELITEGHIDPRPGARNAVHHHIIEPFRRDGETDE